MAWKFKLCVLLMSRNDNDNDDGSYVTLFVTLKLTA